MQKSLRCAVTVLLVAGHCLAAAATAPVTGNKPLKPSNMPHATAPVPSAPAKNPAASAPAKATQSVAGSTIGKPATAAKPAATVVPVKAAAPASAQQSPRTAAPNAAAARAGSAAAAKRSTAVTASPLRKSLRTAQLVQQADTDATLGVLDGWSAWHAGWNSGESLRDVLARSNVLLALVAHSELSDSEKTELLQAVQDNRLFTAAPLVEKVFGTFNPHQRKTVLWMIEAEDTAKARVTGLGVEAIRQLDAPISPAGIQFASQQAHDWMKSNGKKSPNELVDPSAAGGGSSSAGINFKPVTPAQASMATIMACAEQHLSSGPINPGQGGPITNGGAGNPVGMESGWGGGGAQGGEAGKAGTKSKLPKNPLIDPEGPDHSKGAQDKKNGTAGDCTDVMPSKGGQVGKPGDTVITKKNDDAGRRSQYGWKVSCDGCGGFGPGGTFDKDGGTMTFVPDTLYLDKDGNVEQISGHMEMSDSSGKVGLKTPEGSVNGDPQDIGHMYGGKKKEAENKVKNGEGKSASGEGPKDTDYDGDVDKDDDQDTFDTDPGDDGDEMPVDGEAGAGCNEKNHSAYVDCILAADGYVDPSGCDQDGSNGLKNSGDGKTKCGNEGTEAGALPMQIIQMLWDPITDSAGFTLLFNSALQQATGAAQGAGGTP